MHPTIGQSLKRRCRDAVLPVLWETGVLRAIHRLRNEHSLTVFGLHRVLAEGDPRARFAMPDWTISRALFRDFLRFVNREYSVVALDSVLDAMNGGPSLPRRAALLTFDDGWADTADTALPILREMGLPAVVFVVSGMVGQRTGCWESEWYAALCAADARDVDQVRARLRPGQARSADRERDFDDILRVLQLKSLLGGELDQGAPLMVDERQLAALIAGGVCIGAHSVTHEPLVRNPSADEEIRESLSSLDTMARRCGSRVRSFSYPHGSYNAHLVGVARACGAELQFTSDLLLTPLSAQRPAGAVLGRVWAGQRLATRDGRLDRAEAAWSFFRYPAETLSGEQRQLPFQTNG